MKQDRNITCFMKKIKKADADINASANYQVFDPGTGKEGCKI